MEENVKENLEENMDPYLSDNLSLAPLHLLPVKFDPAEGVL